MATGTTDKNKHTQQHELSTTPNTYNKHTQTKPSPKTNIDQHQLNNVHINIKHNQKNKHVLFRKTTKTHTHTKTNCTHKPNTQKHKYANQARITTSNTNNKPKNNNNHTQKT